MSPIIDPVKQAFRCPPPPSPRNLLIYDEVRLLGHSQVAVAQRHGISQRRVSQICQQTDRWHARLRQSAAPGERAKRLRQANRLLARRRHERLFALAVQALEREQQPLVVEKQIHRGGQTTHSRTSRSQPANVQWIKIARQVARQLVQIDEEAVNEATDRSAQVPEEAALARELIGRLIAESTADGPPNAAENEGLFTSSRSSNAGPLISPRSGVRDCPARGTKSLAGNHLAPLPARGSRATEPRAKK